ncbi:MAG: ARMT1-like domain-containing protein [Chloroflexi bacterium]|nr:ARMT1-like domain-containing protein [Chloroflexota bacterium]
MRISTECHDCLSNMADQACALATDDIALRNEARQKVEKILNSKLKPGVVSIQVATPMHDVIKRITGNPDPYRSTKDIEIGEARQLFELVKNSYPEGFISYLRLAALGNAIDFFRPIEEVKREIRALNLQFAVDDSSLLESKVTNAKYILYLADNAGEVFFDMPLLNLMRRYAHTVYVVKENPVQNDITIEDIRKSGMGSVVGEVMTTGTATPGVSFSLASEEFKLAFDKADFVFAKGMGYYETLEELTAESRIFFCLKAKCGPVARSLRVPLDSYVAKLH